MDQKLLLCIALADGAKTVDELWKILLENTNCFGSRIDFLNSLHTLVQPYPSAERPAVHLIRQLPNDNDRIELTTDGHVWLCRQPEIRFVVDRMNNLERNGLPRD